MTNSIKAYMATSRYLSRESSTTKTFDSDDESLLSSLSDTQSSFDGEDVASALGDTDVVLASEETFAAPASDQSAAQFLSIPTEVHGLIANFLPTDYDIYNYALTCRVTGDAVRICNSSIFSARFRELFDNEPLVAKALGDKYKLRRTISKLWTSFAPVSGTTRAEDRQVQKVQNANRQRCLTTLRGIILAADGLEVLDGNGKLITQSLNFDFVKNLITGQNGVSYLDILDEAFCTVYDTNIERKLAGPLSPASAKSELYAIQLCLGALMLHPDFCNGRTRHFDLSQHHVYTSPTEVRLFFGYDKRRMNIEYCAHVINFFKYHLKNTNQGNLAHEYLALDGDQLPSLWCGTVQSKTQPLDTNWKCAHMFLNENDLASCRQWSKNENKVYTDWSDSFQDMALCFDDDELFNTPEWRTYWERWDEFLDYETAPVRGTKGATKEPASISFSGTSQGPKFSCCFGKMHAVAPQGGVSGFQRLVMVQYNLVPDESGNDVYETCAFEGLVLPGNRMVVGRWWYVHHWMQDGTLYGGPFLWWNVHPSATSHIISREKVHEVYEIMRHV